MRLLRSAAALVPAVLVAAGCGSAPDQTGTFGAACRGAIGARESLYENAEVEPFLATDPGNPAHLMGVWQQDRYSGGGAIGLLARASFDGGNTWATSSAAFSRCSGGTAANGGDYDRASDPWVAIAPDGTVHQLALSFDVGANAGNRAILASRSTDGGRTWSAPHGVQVDTDPFFAVDKGSITADPQNPSFVYAVWDRLTNQDVLDSPLAHGPAWFARSTDAGASWEAARDIYDPGADAQTIGNAVAVLPDGTLLNAMLVLRNLSTTTTAEIAVLRSTDKGLTWPDPPVTVSGVDNVVLHDPKTTAPVRSGGALPSVAVDASNGHVHVVWEDSRFGGTAYNGIALSTSIDGGRTWSALVQVNRVATVGAFTPAVSAGSGKIAVSYFDVRDDDPADAARYLAGAWLVTSSDGGATWQETRLASPFDLQTAPFAGGYFLGDYQGLAWDGSAFVSLFSAANSGNLADRTTLLFRRVAPPAATLRRNAARAAR